MAGSVNKVIIIGNLGADPEVRALPNGGQVVNLRVATSETWKDKGTGERKERTEWQSIAIFNDGLGERNTGSRAAHLGEEADKAHDGLELPDLEIAAAGDEHFLVTAVVSNRTHDPCAVPAVVAFFARFLANHLDEVAFGQEAAQSVFCNHIRCFFYHGLPWVLSLPGVQHQSHGVATPWAIQDNMYDSKTI